MLPVRASGCLGGARRGPTLSVSWLRRLLAYPAFWPCVWLLCWVPPLPFLAGLLPIVHFVRERIDIAVYPEEVRVEGFYVYQNPWPFPVIQGFSIPLPVDALHPMPTELTATQLTPPAEPIPLRQLFGRDGFDLRFRAHEEVQVVVRYHQLAPTRDARYLLLTTRPWRRPLEHAVYTLTPHGVSLTGSNYALRLDAQGILGFERTNFMPPDDWSFGWKEDVK